MEILVPFDTSVGELGTLYDQFPNVRFLPLGSIFKQRTLDPTSKHELYDRRRAAGLRAARGRFIAILEDRGKPDRTWSRTMMEVHREGNYGAVGGAIQNGATSISLWAVFFCDFGRFQPPLHNTAPEYLSDINICYSRTALESVRNLWVDRYQEPTVNWALRNKNVPLLLSDKPLVIQERQPLGILALLRERWHWGRIFGRIRGRNMSFPQCIAWAVACLALPPLLLARHARTQIQKKRHLWTFVLATPVMSVLLVAWACGECFGYCDAARGKAG
jgi:hypothetical protein